MNNAKKQNPDISLNLNTRLIQIIKDEDHYKVKTDNGEFHARTVVIAAGGHSLLIAKSLGYGKDLVSIINGW